MYDARRQPVRSFEANGQAADFLAQVFGVDDAKEEPPINPFRQALQQQKELRFARQPDRTSREATERFDVEREAIKVADRLHRFAVEGLIEDKEPPVNPFRQALLQQERLRTAQQTSRTAVDDAESFERRRGAEEEEPPVNAFRQALLEQERLRTAQQTRPTAGDDAESFKPRRGAEEEQEPPVNAFRQALLQQERLRTAQQTRQTAGDDAESFEPRRGAEEEEPPVNAFRQALLQQERLRTAQQTRQTTGDDAESFEPGRGAEEEDQAPPARPLQGPRLRQERTATNAKHLLRQQRQEKLLAIRRARLAAEAKAERSEAPEASQGPVAGVEASVAEEEEEAPEASQGPVAGVEASVAEEEEEEPVESARSARFVILNEAWDMELPPKVRTPGELLAVWEEDWHVTYARRLKLEVKAPEGSRRRFLQREDEVPTAPEEVSLHGVCSVLQSLHLAFRERSGAANAPPPERPEPPKGPRCPGTFRHVDAQAVKRANDLVSVMKILGFGSQGNSSARPAEEEKLEEESLEEEPEPEEEKVEEESLAEDPGQPDEEAVPGESEEEEAVLDQIFGLCGFSEDEIEHFKTMGPISSYTGLASLAKTPDQAKQLAINMNVWPRARQALFAEAWRRCSLKVLGPREDYPAALVRAIYEVDFTALAMNFLEVVRATLSSDQFVAAADGLLDNWKRRPKPPSSEEKMEDVATICFDLVYAQMLPLYGFTPDQKGKKAAQAAVRLAGKERPEVRALDAQLMKATMQRFSL